MTFKITFYILVSVAIIWILTIGALLFALRAFSDDLNKASTVAKGSVYMTVFALSIVLQIAIIFRVFFCCSRCAYGASCAMKGMRLHPGNILEVRYY